MSIYKTCAIGASNPVRSLSQTQRIPIPVESSSGLMSFLNASVTAFPAPSFLAFVIYSGSLLPQDETTARTFNIFNLASKSSSLSPSGFSSSFARYWGISSLSI